MKSKNFMILCGVLAILLALVFIKKEMKQTPPTTEPWIKIIEQNVDQRQISEILVSLQDKTIHLNQVNDRWQVASQFQALADEEKINAFLKKLNHLDINFHIFPT